MRILSLLAVLFVSVPAFAAPFWEASDGPFWATLRGESLSVRYVVRPESGLKMCAAGRTLKVNLVLVTGPESNRISISKPMRVDCVSNWGDNSGLSDSASWSLSREADPSLWDQLFPAREDGSRWYALRVAVSSEWGEWDSRNGYDYRLIFQPRE